MPTLKEHMKKEKLTQNEKRVLSCTYGLFRVSRNFRIHTPLSYFLKVYLSLHKINCHLIKIYTIFVSNLKTTII